MTFLGGYKPYRMIVHKNIPIKSISVEIMPTYYEKYLNEQYPDQYKHPIDAFKEIDQVRDWPDMKRLFFELRNYRKNEGLASNLFFESKVNECLALVLNYSVKEEHKSCRLSNEDIKALMNVIDYINDHYVFEILLERLANIAYMGTKKLKTSFKEFKGMTITEYIQDRRMSQAEHLLLETDLDIAQIARTVGYSTSSRFATLFKRTTGLLPNEFKKIARK